MYVCVCMYVCMYVCIYIFICVCIYIYIYNSVKDEGLNKDLSSQSNEDEGRIISQRTS